MAALIQDEFGKVTLRFYHIYKNLTDKIKPGNRLRIFGEVRVGARGLELYHPEIQLINEHTPFQNAAHSNLSKYRWTNTS